MKRVGYCKNVGLLGVSDEQSERENVLFGWKKKNVLFDNALGLVYITLYIVYIIYTKHNIWYRFFGISAQNVLDVIKITCYTI